MFGVDHQPDRSKPYQARVTRGGKKVFLGSFATAEEAALYVARSPEGREAAERAEAARPPSPALTSEEARQQAPAEGLTLLVADNKTGYLGVHHQPDKAKPYIHKCVISRCGSSGTNLPRILAKIAAVCVLGIFRLLLPW